jgi:hypothetical protein
MAQKPLTCWTTSSESERNTGRRAPTRLAMQMANERARYSATFCRSLAGAYGLLDDHLARGRAHHGADGELVADAEWPPSKNDRSLGSLARLDERQLLVHAERAPLDQAQAVLLVAAADDPARLAASSFTAPDPRRRSS